MTTWLLVLIIQSAIHPHQIEVVQFGTYHASLACEDQGLRLKNASVSKRLEYSCWEVEAKK